MTVRRIVDRLAGATFAVVLVATLALCFVPVLLILGLSFFADGLIEFPPRDPSLELYSQLAESADWREAIGSSFKLGIPTAVLVLAVVTPAAIALERARVRGRSAIEFAALLPLLMPATGYAVALYVIYLKLGWAGWFPALVLAEAIVVAPVAFLIMRAAIQRMPARLDFVAMSLGASRPRAIWDVTVNLLRPALLASALFVMVRVFDDVVFVTFLGGPDATTLSKAIYDSLSYALDPVVLALSTVFMVFMGVLIASAMALDGRRGR